LREIRRRLVVQENESKVGPGNVVDDYDAICQVVQLAQEGDSTGDVAKMTEAVHASARIWGTYSGKISSLPIAEYIQQRASDPADTGSHRWRITSVQQTGNVAAAVVAEDGYHGRNSIVSYWLLARIDGSWKIVSVAAQSNRG
jgi:hypothetical protein